MRITKINTATKHRLCHLATLIGLCLGLVPAVWAHHSQSEYDSRAKVDVMGTVTKVEWKSPHAWFYVDVTSDKEGKVNWSFELPSPNTLMRRGWTRDSVKPGDKVKVTGARARNYPTIALATSVRDSNDKPLFTGATEIYEPEPAAKGAR